MLIHKHSSKNNTRALEDAKTKMPLGALKWKVCVAAVSNRLVQFVSFLL